LKGAVQLWSLEFYVIQIGSGPMNTGGGGGVVCSVLKRPGSETHHSPSTSAEVKNTWVYISTPPYVFMA
jgi:hypothetical protein